MGDGEADALGDVAGLAAAVFVEYPHRHQLRPVGEAGERDRVVGLLADRPGDVGAVAVFVERHAVVVDEVIALDELSGGEVGAAHEPAAQVAVGDAGVEHGDGHAFGPWSADFGEVAPGADRVDAAGGDAHPPRRFPLGGEEVPLLEGPVAGRGGRFGGAVEGAGVVGEEEARGWFGGGGRGRGDVVGLGVGDPRVVAQGGGRLAHAGAGGQRQRAPARLPVELDDDLARREPVRGGDRRRGARAGEVGGEPCEQGRGGEYRQQSSHLVGRPPGSPRCGRALELTPACRRSCGGTYSRIDER